MTEESKEQQIWASPNPNTIQFSEKKQEAMFKPFEFMDQDKLSEIGHDLQKEILSEMQEAATANNTAAIILTSSNLELENQIFIRRMTAFISELSKWTERDESNQMSRLNFLKVDLLYIKDLQNVFCEYLQHFSSILSSPKLDSQQWPLKDQDGGQNGPFTFDKVKLVVKALRIMIHSGTNCAFFGCLQIILQIVTHRESFKTQPDWFRRQSITVYEDMTAMIETLFHKMYEQSRPFQMLFGSQEKWDTNFKKVATQFQLYCEAIMTNFATLTQLMLYKDGQGAQEHIKVLKEQEGCELTSKLEKLQQNCDLLVSSNITDVRDCFTLHTSTMSLLMGQYFDLVKSQRGLFEKYVDPSKVVQNLILIVSSSDPYFTPNVRVRCLKVLEFLTELDMHPEFKYSSERSNPYFEVVLKNFQAYVSISKKFADFYSASNLEKFDEQMREESKTMQIDEGNDQRQNNLELTDIFASQRFMRAFLGFMYTLVTFRTRPMLTQLYPQLVDPIITIVTIKPTDQSYIVNLDCQKIALQILKEISRSNISFDNQNQLILLIERLKAELVILKDDYENYDTNNKACCKRWLPYKYDDSLGRSHTLAKRQDLIGSFLRFLCYTIIRMDPNQISINQNFVSHSRKILESHIFEEFLIDLVFKPNFEKSSTDEDRVKFEKVIDPIFLTCVQLSTYVFNDLHQKIGEYLENGILPCIIDSLSRRIPRQHDFLILTAKFMRLLLLNKEATKLMYESNILANMQMMARDHEAYNEFFSLYQNRDQQSLLSQLANESQELSDQMLQGNVQNMKFAIEESWVLTENFLESEKLNALPGESPQQIEKRKDIYQRKQAEFEKVIENICLMLLFQVHEQLDSFFTGPNETNVMRSIKKQTDLNEVLMHVITTPTICSAAPSFLLQGGFSDLMTVIMILTGKDKFASYIDQLNNLLINQIAAVKSLLGVDQLNLFNPRDLSKLKAKKLPQIAESDPDKLELLFDRYQMSAETQLWVTVAKIHAYIELILAAEAISRNNHGEAHSQVCIDYFTRPEIGSNKNCLRSDILYLEELLRAFKHVKYIEKFTKKVGRQTELLQKFEERIKQVDWNEFVVILEPHNDFEEALNLYYILEFAKVDSFKVTDNAEVKTKFRIMLNPGDEDVPESSLCKKKCLFFVNRVSSIFRREKQFVLGSQNSELKKFSETGADVIYNLVKSMAEKCSIHLETVLQGTNVLTDGVDLDLLELKLRAVPLMQEICQIFTNNKKASRSAPTAFFLLKLLDLGILEDIFTILDWAAQVLLAFDSKSEKKLLLHYQVLHECLIAPMNLIALLISGEFLKKGEIKFYLQPNELSSKLAVYKLRLAMMSQLVQPVLEHVVHIKSDQILLIADMYDKDFSLLVEGIMCVLSANAFFGTGSAFDPEGLKAVTQQYDVQKNKNIQSIEKKAAQHNLVQQIANMGFKEVDVVAALAENNNDFERSLEQLLKHNETRIQEEEEIKEESQSETQQKVSEDQKPITDKGTKQSMIDTSQRAVTEVPEEVVMQQQSVGDASEIEAANELEFRQRRKTTIQMVASALVQILPNHLTHAMLSKRQQILTSFLCQTKKEEDKEVKDQLQLEILGMIERLLNKVSTQQIDTTSVPDLVMEHSKTTGLDWMLVDCVKWAMASDQINLPQKFAFSNLAQIVTSQINKKLAHMGALVRHENLKDQIKEGMADSEKNQLLLTEAAFNRSIMNTMFSLWQYIRVMTCIIESLKYYKSLQTLQQMMIDAKLTDTALNLDDLTKITNELGFQMHQLDPSYFGQDQEKRDGILNVTIDAEKIAEHLQSYISCIHGFFKELSNVSGSFQENYGATLNPIICKAMRCLNMMAQIGQIGNFDFARSFLQKNFIKVILQAKVVDKNFIFETDCWRLAKKPELTPFVDLEVQGRQWHHQICGMFRSIIREVSTPKKEWQRRLEITIKRQLYKQFLQNFKRGEQIDLHEYLESLCSARGRSLGQNKDAEEPVQKMSTNQQRAKTKAKVNIVSKEDGFAKPQSKLTNRSKSEEKLNNNQAGNKKSQQNANVYFKGQMISNKLLKRLLVKYDDYNISKLDDFIGFNKIAMREHFVTYNHDFLQACSRIAVIKTVDIEVDNGAKKDPQKLQVVVDSSETTQSDIVDVLTRIHGVAPDKLIPINDQALTYIAEYRDTSIVKQACDQGQVKMSLHSRVHQLTFSKAALPQDEESKQPKGETKQELQIMLKRQVLRDLIFDPDQNQHLNFSMFGQDAKDTASQIQPTKTQNELTHQLLEMLVEQTRGMKMDMLKILRNPSSCLQADKEGGEPTFSHNDTTLKIVKQDAQNENKEETDQFKLVIDTASSKSNAKLFFVDYAAILNSLVDILEKQSGQVETVLKHNDGKTLKFLLRNIFFIMSCHVDGKKDNQIVFKNMQSYKQQKLSDRLQIVICFFKAMTTITKNSTLKQQMAVQDIQKLLISVMSKSLVQVQRQKQAVSSIPQQHAEACQYLTDSAKLVGQYNTVWILTQYLFYKPAQTSMTNPEDAIINQAIKLDEHVKHHIVRQILLETQALDAKNSGSLQVQQIVPNEPSSSLAFLSHIKKLLDNLEGTKFLFMRAKVPCMHMCIWAVTSILKMFENQPELFLRLHGPPPPPSDDESDYSDSGREKDESNMNADYDLDMQSQGSDADQDIQQPSGSQPHQHLGFTDSVPECSDDSSDEDDESGEEEMDEEESYGSMGDCMEGNDDLSSNRDQSLADQDMAFEQIDDDGEEIDFDNDSLSSCSDYSDSEDMLIEMMPRAVIQSAAPVKGQDPSNDNSYPVDRNFEMAIEAQQNQVEEIGFPEAAGAIGEVDAAQEDESYYSEQEGDSYEPPLTYDQENVSALSFNSENDHREAFIDDIMDGGHHHDRGANQGDDDEYEDFDNIESYSASDDESEHHHHHHGHNHSQERYINHHPMSVAHLPVHVQLWHQVSVIETDPLESKVIQWINSLQAVLESVSDSHWPYRYSIPSIQTPIGQSQGADAVENLSNPKKTESSGAGKQPNQQDSSKKAKNDDIVHLNPEDFRDKPQAGAIVVNVTNLEQATSNEPPAQQQNALEIEGMDPLFLESLGPQGLQNLADTHQIQNRVVNSANMISRDPRSLNSDQSRYENILSTLQSQPEHVQNQIMNQVQLEVQQRAVTVNTSNVDQIINAIQNNIGVNDISNQAQDQGQALAVPSQTEARGRFMSIDTVAVSMFGPNESSRQVQPQSSLNNQETKVKDITNKVRIRGSQFMQNAFNDLQDLIARFTKTPTVSQSEVKCTEMLKQHLLPQDSESTKAKFSKIHDCMHMALIGFKIFEKDDLQIQSRIRLLFRIPSLRICLILRVLKLINSEVDKLVEHRDLCQQKKEYTTYKSKELMPFIDKEGGMILQQMPIDQTILVTLSIIEQLQECLLAFGLSKAATQQSIEIAQQINNDELLGQLSELSGLNLDSNSIIQSVLRCLKRYFDTVTSDPWLLATELSKQTQKTSLYNHVLGSLRKILHPLSKVSKLAIPVEQICELVVAPTGCNKLTKQGHQHARKILNDISEKTNVTLIQSHMENRLEQALKSMIKVLKDRENAMNLSKQESIPNEKFIQLLEDVKELLKLSSGVQKFKNTNICRQDTLASLFSMANVILTKEQEHAERSDKSTQGQTQIKEVSSTSNAFMYRNDIKEMILILFALCEYNLRIVFSGAQAEPQPPITTAEATTTLTQSPPQNVIDTTSGGLRQSSSDQEMMQESHAEIYRVIESQIVANQQGGQQSSDSKHQLIDRRLKTIISFFISNKKLINIFIRVNQQVVNVQLKNLVIKIPQILEFDTKRLIWRVMLKKLKSKVKGGQWDIPIRRDQAFDDSFEMMRKAKPDEWKSQLRIAFQDEAGVDEGGLTKEWFTLLSKHMFNEDMALFLKASTGSTYFPNPKSVVQADHLDLFDFIGKFVGKALMDQQLLECYFVKAFYKLLLDMPLGQADLEDYDQELYKSLTWILQNEGAEHLCSYFVETQDYFGEAKDYELCEGGAERLVTDENKEEYVKLVANYRLNQAIKAQITAFKTGLFTIVPKDLIKIFDNRELELLISGLQVVDIDDLRENTVYQGYTATSKPVQVFWEALREFDNSERAEFIQFVTGSSKVPVEGFKGLRGQNGIQKFTIAQVNSSDQNRLPQSHTCVNQLDLPQYKDKETAKRNILISIKEGKTFAIA